MSMVRIGIIREGKYPPDNRVAFTPSQCKWLQKNFPSIQIIIQPSSHRCFSDREYERAGVELNESLANCEYIFGIKEVPVAELLPDKKYLFFSHTKKLQPYNQAMLRAIMERKITLIDYECMEHEDGQRIIGFGFFAGIVGAHNGMMSYGIRSGTFSLDRVYKQKNFKDLIHNYFELKLPPIKVAVTGSGRVSHGILEVMNLMQIHEVEPEDYLQKTFSYPVYTQLKGADLYRNKVTGRYSREEFHANPSTYECLFLPYAAATDILMNGIYWEEGMPRLFETGDVKNPSFKISTIADVTDDAFGSVPINLGDQTIKDPIYGVNRETFQKTAPFLPDSIDVMAVGNLPNELPRDASRYFGEQLIKFILEDLLFKEGVPTIERATIAKQGHLTQPYEYMRAYAGFR